MAEVFVNHAFVNPQPDDAGPDVYVKPKHWNAKLLFTQGSDADLITRDTGSSTGAGYRTLTGGAGISITPSAGTLTVALSGTVIGGSGTTNRVVRWTGATTLGDASIRDDGTLVGINTAVDVNSLMIIGGSFSGPGAQTRALLLNANLSPAVSADAYVLNMGPTINKAGSGTHADFASVFITPPNIAGGGATITNLTTLKINGAGSAGVNNYALWINGGSIRADGVGPHAIGGALATNVALYILGSFTPGAGTGTGVRFEHNITPAVGADGALLIMAGTLIEAASGTHVDMTGFRADAPTLTTAGGATTTNASTVKITGEPTGATNNYALWVSAGKVRVDSSGPHVIGGSPNTFEGLALKGTFVPGAGGSAFGLSTTVTASVGGAAYGMDIYPTLNKAGSGTHADFASVIVEAPVIGAGAATLTNATTLKVLSVPTVGDRVRSLWVAAGLSEFTGIVSISGAGGTVNNTQVGIELRGSSTPSLTAFNRNTVAYLNMIYDAALHEFRDSGNVAFRVGDTDAQIWQGGTWTGSVQTEGHRQGTTLNAIASANAFGLIFVPTFVEASSGTHGQLTGIYVAPAFTGGAGSTTNVFGINIDTIAAGAVTPTTATALRIAVPTGGTTNYGIQMTGRFENTSAVPHSFGATLNTGIELFIAGNFDSGQSFARGMQLGMTMTANADGGNMTGLYINPTLTERSGGTHSILSGIYLEPAITAGAASVTEAASIYIAALTAQSGTSIASGLHIEAPTGATTNYGIIAGGSIRFTSVGPHAIGSTLDATQQIRIAGSFTSASNVEGIRFISTLTPAASSNAFGMTITPSFVEGTGGAHTDFVTLYVEPTVTAGTSTLTTLTGIKVASLVAQTGTTNAILIDVRTLPTGATNNFVFAFPTDATDPTAGGGAATGRIPCLINGALRYLAYY